MTDISEAKILIIATDGFEDSELLEPRRRLIEAGAEIVLASPKTGQIEGDKGATITVDQTLDEVQWREFDALLLPGGTKNPDKLRMEPRAVEMVRAFVEAGRPVGAICHAPWLLVEADVLSGRTVTGWPSVRTDLRNAGAEVVDREAVTDGNIVTSRNPDDIPAFTEAFVRLVETADALQESA